MARTDLSPIRQLALAVAWALFVLGTCIAINARVGKTEAAPSLAGGALPPALIGTTTASSSSEATQSSSSGGSSAPSTVVVTVTKAPKLRVPIAIDIPFPSADYPDGMQATVTSDHRNGDGSLYVPDDPKTVSWAEDYAAPGAPRGTIIMTSHVNFVIDGQTVVGAFADLAEYARTSIGKRFTVTMADGTRQQYQIIAGREYNKDQLAADPGLRTDLYDQVKQYGSPGKPRTARLLLVSCGGAFDNASGNYEDNVFLYALPVASA